MHFSSSSTIGQTPPDTWEDKRKYCLPSGGEPSSVLPGNLGTFGESCPRPSQFAVLLPFLPFPMCPGSKENICCLIVSLHSLVSMVTSSISLLVLLTWDIFSLVKSDLIMFPIVQRGHYTKQCVCWGELLLASEQKSITFGIALPTKTLHSKNVYMLM